MSTVHTKQTECDSSHQESRNGCRMLLFGDGTVEDTLDGGPSVSLTAIGGLSASRMR